MPNDVTDMGEDVNSYHLATLTNTRHYCESQEPEQCSLTKDLDTRIDDVANRLRTVKKHKKLYSNYIGEQRFLFVYYNQAKLSQLPSHLIFLSI
jgi:hypothetical protein